MYRLEVTLTVGEADTFGPLLTLVINSEDGMAVSSMLAGISGWTAQHLDTSARD